MYNGKGPSERERERERESKILLIDVNIECCGRFIVITTVLIFADELRVRDECFTKCTALCLSNGSECQGGHVTLMKALSDDKRTAGNDWSALWHWTRHSPLPPQTPPPADLSYRKSRSLQSRKQVMIDVYVSC